MQMIRVGVGAIGVGQSRSERAITPSSEARHLSCLFRFRAACPDSGRSAENKSKSLDALEVKCANQLSTMDQRRITDAFQFSCLIIICLIKLRMCCDCHVAALFVLKNRFIDHRDYQLKSDLLIWSIEFRFIDLIDWVLIDGFHKWFANNWCITVHRSNFQDTLVDWHLNIILSQCNFKNDALRLSNLDVDSSNWQSCSRNQCQLVSICQGVCVLKQQSL